ncbi:TetR/AcrR family transcriptional regulator C-terminal domain-containing protein, partial [Novosphingobium sp. Fuku2-ISO-50]|uniref:TetR/AcrR family transcriptional regulator C-terminal domain-containing protein n=1 Tax=Novosphingobium sp. Fuku2-ISO-50 TaxID=1739114 RepID=UPI000ACA1825
MVGKALSKKRAVRADATARDQLLEAVGALMAERESIDFSLSDVAKKSGLNAGLVRYYFGNKAGMMMAYVQEVVGSAVTQVEQLANMPVGAKEKLRIHIYGAVSNYYKHPYINILLQYMMKESNGEYKNTIMNDIIKRLVFAEQKILEDGQAEGVFKVVDPLLFYFYIFGACEAIFRSRDTVKYFLDADDVNEDIKQKYTKQLCDLVMNGLGCVDKRG